MIGQAETDPPIGVAMAAHVTRCAVGLMAMVVAAVEAGEPLLSARTINGTVAHLARATTGTTILL